MFMENGTSDASLAEAPESLRELSIAPSTSVDHFESYPASSRKMPPISSKPGHATSPMSSPAKIAAFPLTPVSANFRGIAALFSSRRHSSAHNTPIGYAQTPGQPFIKNEPMPASPYHLPYASVPHIQGSQTPQASPRPEGLYFATSHSSVQYSSINGNGHLRTANTDSEIKVESPLPPPLPAQLIEDHHMGVTGRISSAEDVDHNDVDFQYAPPSIHLQTLAKEVSTKKLEAGIRVGVQLLARLAQAFERVRETDDIRHWLQQIELVRQEATDARTVIGVVGNTGAGKSSVIHAILDEERLVPTNCMRACTAVVTEISWNASDDENDKYRAEIEFIKPAEWETELRILFQEVIDGSGGISREVSNPDSQAGIAYAKIRAVYWCLTKDDLIRSSTEELMTDHTVRGLLGTTEHVRDRHCDTFYKTVQHYVDSKEKLELTKESKNEEEDNSKGTGDKNKKKKKETRKREQEFWPLIKVIRLYVKADALSTGAVLVDLPGSADSNAARAAVAEEYTKQCTGLWIVSPINRAVDDKAAKHLLGSTFRRQLKYDGTYSAVTFICSKTDDISNTEATDSLSLADEIEELDDQLILIEHQRRETDKEARKLEDQKMALRNTMDNCDDVIEEWEALEEKLIDGKTVYPPVVKTRKRKRSLSSTGSGDEDEDRYSDESSNKSQSPDRGPSLTAEDIETKIQELKDQKKEARLGRTEIEAEIKELKTKIKDFKAEVRSIEDNRSRICISARNQYSKSAIQVDFAAGIKELDEETAEEENPDFDPGEELRDYEKVARDLPVYCVSSRAYQKLSGRLAKDNAVRSFTDVEQTEVPALRLHCKKLTENVRSIKSRRFLTLLGQLRTSLSLWSSNDSSGAKETDQQKDTEQRYLFLELKDLEKALEKGVNDTVTEIKETMNENIFENYETAINAAANAALLTSEGWSAHQSLGGLYWATYKAVVRRRGVFTGKGGLSDFNAQLTEPIYKHLANGWEQAFQRRLPLVLSACAKGFSNTMRAFHKAIEVHSFPHRGDPRLDLLAQQLTNYEAVFNDLGSKMLDLINERQRDINREFTPNICNAMLIVYNLCIDESGPGQYNRMKNHMADHVTAQKDTIFRDATQVVRTMIMDLIKDVEEHMANHTDQLFAGMRRDYLQVLDNICVEGIRMPKWERSLRGTIEDIIRQSEENFEAILEGREIVVLEDKVSAGALEVGDIGTDDEDADQKKKMEIEEDFSRGISGEDLHMDDAHA
ncbi:hypothetical protein KCU99_g9481, partial [Aureobasidium melanogenum]